MMDASCKMARCQNYACKTVFRPPAAKHFGPWHFFVIVAVYLATNWLWFCCALKP